MLNEIKQQVYDANIELFKRGLVIFTWGNVSQRTSDDLIVIKPSGVPYEVLKPQDMVVLDLNGNVIDGELNPSSDTPTHLELYKAFPDVCGVCHTHSTHATSFAQAGKGIECFGTTHADYFYGTIPCTRNLSQEEVEQSYEKNTGKVIVETFEKLDYKAIHGILVKSHGVFTWGENATKSVENAIVLEEIAKMNFQTIMLNSQLDNLSKYILDKHYLRKHGDNAYYGQKK